MKQVYDICQRCGKTICIPKPSHSGKFIYKTDSGEVIRFEYYKTEDEYEASKKG